MFSMQALLTIALFVFSGEFGVASKLAGKTVGGQTASITSFPFIASICSYNDYHICGGTIIQSSYILTAAHCFRNRYASQLLVYVGTDLLSKRNKAYKVNRIIIHPQYNSELFINDIAIIELSSPIPKSINTQKVARYGPCLNDGIHDVTALGWGYQKTGDKFLSDKLNQVELWTTYTDYCKTSWRNLGANSICTLFPGKGVCNGDSGGPLLYLGQLIGITVYGAHFACSSIFPDVFTRICNYEPWIRANQLKPGYL